MAKLLTLEAMGYRDAMGHYAARTEALQKGLRDELRSEAKVFLEVLRFYAPEKSGKFKRGLRYRTDETPDGATVTFYASGEHAFLLPILLEGTKSHPITAKGKALRFYWEHGPRGPGIYYYHSVMHPGTMPDPFVALAIAAREPHIDMALYRISRKVIWL